jgi:undecaprenyl-diphosphatase
MELIEAIVLGIVQGLTEWFPISSEGINSLILVNFFNKTLLEAAYLSIWLHTGTVLAAIVYFRRELADLMRDIPRYIRQRDNQLMTFLIVSTLLSVGVAAPIALIGLDAIDASFATLLIGLLLIVTGVMQLVSRRGDKLRTEPTNTDSLITGVAQGFAALPGLSRSGLTTSALLLRKYTAKDAVKLSFLMSIPFIIVAQIGLGATANVTVDLNSFFAIGISFIVGLATIKAFMEVAKRVNFGKFCVGLGILASAAFFI